MVLLAYIIAVSVAVVSASNCPIQNDTTIAYSLVDGVGPASEIWVQDLLWWWQSYDPSVKYVPLYEKDFQNCDLQSYPNLRVYINPGGKCILCQLDY